MQTYGDSPAAEHSPPDSHDRILHVSLPVGPVTLMGSDARPVHYKPAQGLWVSLNLEDPAEAERLFGALAEGGSVTMPLEATFWAKRFGMLTDRFGTPWMVNCA